MAEEIISKMPMPRRSVIGSQNIITANNTADTGSNAPSMATGVEPISCMAALVHRSEKAVGKKAMARASAHSHGELARTMKLLDSKLHAKRNVPKKNDV